MASGAEAVEVGSIPAVDLLTLPERYELALQLGAEVGSISGKDPQYKVRSTDHRTLLFLFLPTTDATPLPLRLSLSHYHRPCGHCTRWMPPPRGGNGTAARTTCQ